MPHPKDRDRGARRDRERGGRPGRDRRPGPPPFGERRPGGGSFRDRRAGGEGSGERRPFEDRGRPAKPFREQGGHGHQPFGGRGRERREPVDQPPPSERRPFGRRPVLDERDYEPAWLRERRERGGGQGQRGGFGGERGGFGDRGPRRPFEKRGGGFHGGESGRGAGERRPGDRGRGRFADRERQPYRERREGPAPRERFGEERPRAPEPFREPREEPGESGDRVTRVNPLFEILKASPNRINKIFIQKGGGAHRVGDIVEQARAHGIPVIFVPKEKMDRSAPHHQGVIAFIAAKEFSTLEEILAGAGPKPFLVLLDEIEDPQNIGAILRSAEAAGAHGVVLPERRSAGLTEAVDTVSAGALAHLKVARVTNLVRTMEELKEKGFWIVGAESGGEGPWTDFDYTSPVAIVLGSEGRGLRPLVRERCDKVLAIPLLGEVTSLNVAAAAAVFFFEVVRQRTGVAPKVPDDSEGFKG